MKCFFLIEMYIFCFYLSILSQKWKLSKKILGLKSSKLWRWSSSINTNPLIEYLPKYILRYPPYQSFMVICTMSISSMMWTKQSRSSLTVQEVSVPNAVEVLGNRLGLEKLPLGSSHTSPRNIKWLMVSFSTMVNLQRYKSVHFKHAAF